MPSAAKICESLPTSRPFSILLAEDSEVTQDLLKMFLTDRGHKVCAVSDGEAALELLYSKSFDLVLIDYHIPKKDGLEVVVEYKAKKPHAKSPKFIGITADIEGLLAHPQNCENFDKVFCKPFNPAQLCDDLERFAACNEEAGPLPSSNAVIVLADLGTGIPFEPIRDNLYQFPPSQNKPVDQTSKPENKLACDPDDGQHKERRHSKRLNGALGGTTITMSDDTSQSCQISSISSGGAAITLTVRPEIGEKVVIGKTPAWVVRHTESGIAVEFGEQLCRRAELY